MAIRGMQSGYFMRDGTSAEGEEKYFNKNFLLLQIMEEMLSRAPQIRCWANSVKPRLPLLIISLSSHNRAARLILKMHFSFVFGPIEIDDKLTKLTFLTCILF